MPDLLDKIRPAWKAKSLITRVQRLIAVDPSSACQRLLNATIHDLKEKVIIAGIDIAKEAAKQYKLPPVENSEDIESYSTTKTIEETMQNIPELSFPTVSFDPITNWFNSFSEEVHSIICSAYLLFLILLS